jgi:prepilin-type N-terminal cleavage/methylation domain-containing protein
MSVLSKSRSGFTLVEIMLVILIISMLLLIAIPSFMAARERSQAKTCIAQLRQIRYAKESWAMDFRKDPGDEPALGDLYPVYLKDNPECPLGGVYSINAVNTDPACSIGGNHTLD